MPEERNPQQSGAKKALWSAGLCALAPLLCLAGPTDVIRPFVPQATQALRWR
jgi:hypothetical protein